MKKTLILFFLTAFCTISAFSAPRIIITQSTRDEEGNYKTFETPIFKMKKIESTGGKIYIKYDFTITETDKTSFWQNPPGDIVILLKFPKYYFDNGSCYSFFMDEDFFKVTSLSGARDLTKDLLRAYSGTEHYSVIQKIIGRLPSVFSWVIRDNSEIREHSCCIPLVLENKQGNKASLEFYIDIGELFDAYFSLDEEKKAGLGGRFCSWTEGILHEIPIDISFHDRNCITAWNYLSDSEYEYDSKSRTAVKNETVTDFFIIADDFYSWQNSYSKSNFSSTLMIRE